jgi:signal transduction histidine kinase
MTPSVLAQRAFDIMLPTAAGLIALAAAAESPAPPAGGLIEPAWLTVVTAVALAVPLVARRRLPIVCALVVAAAAGAVLAAGIVPDFASAGVLVSVGIALYAVGLRAPGRRGEAFALATTGLVVAGSLVADGSSGGPGLAGAGFAALVSAASWTLGATLRERRQQAASAAAQTTARAVAEERLRIAREMHDIVGHSLSLIAVKAAVATHVASLRPEEAGEALQVIEATSRAALAELRRSVGALRTEPDYAGPPTLAGLSVLADRASTAGVQVRLEVRGGEDAPEAVVLAAYRIVQESLTNVVRHAAPAGCAVEVTAGGGELRVEVVDDGTRRAPPAPDGAGLAGMRERVAAHGGRFTAGPRSGGGFAVTATLPYGPPA